MTDRAVMLSIKPKYCELIASGEKTIEVRKTKPKLETPFKCYIYCTKESYKGKYLHTSNQHGKLFFWHNPYDMTITVQPEEYDYTAYACGGKVVGEFVCDKIKWIGQISLVVKEDAEAALKDSCLTVEQIYKYLKLPKHWGDEKYRECYGWHISELVIYDKPKELWEFYKPCTDPYQYCQGCDNGYVLYPSDVETYEDLSGCCFDTVCLNRITKPPQSWCYVQEVSNND